MSKSDQPTSSGYRGDLEFMLSDGGSDYVRRSLNIIQEFSWKHPRINFILVFEAIQTFGPLGTNYVRVYFEKGAGLGREFEEFLSDFHINSESLFPRPVNDAMHAVSSSGSTKPHLEGSFIGGATVSEY